MSWIFLLTFLDGNPASLSWAKRRWAPLDLAVHVLQFGVIFLSYFINISSPSFSLSFYDLSIRAPGTSHLISLSFISSFQWFILLHASILEKCPQLHFPKLWLSFIFFSLSDFLVRVLVLCVPFLWHRVLFSWMHYLLLPLSGFRGFCFYYDYIFLRFFSVHTVFSIPVPLFCVSANTDRVSSHYPTPTPLCQTSLINHDTLFYWT